jgi:hypothetical protein
LATFPATCVEGARSNIEKVYHAKWKDGRIGAKVESVEE